MRTCDVLRAVVDDGHVAEDGQVRREAVQLPAKVVDDELGVRRGKVVARRQVQRKPLFPFH